MCPPFASAVGRRWGTTEEVGRDLEKGLAAGRSLRDDLHYLIERGGSAADRLEGTIRARRDEGTRITEMTAPPRTSASAKVAQLHAADDQEPRGNQISRAERELLRALGGRR